MTDPDPERAAGRGPAPVAPVAPAGRAAPAEPEVIDEPVPRLPRGRGFKVSGPELIRILMTLGMLVALILLTKPCSDSVSRFVMGFEGSGKGSAMPKPGRVDVPAPAVPARAADYERLTPGMSDAELKAAIERARARAGSAAGQGSGASPQPATAPVTTPAAPDRRP